MGNIVRAAGPVPQSSSTPSSPPPPPPVFAANTPVCISAAGFCQDQTGAWKNGVSLDFCTKRRTFENELAYVNRDSGHIFLTRNGKWKAGKGKRGSINGAYYQGNIVVAKANAVKNNVTRCDDAQPGQTAKPYTTCLDVDSNNRVVTRKCRKWGILDTPAQSEADPNHQWILESV